jgi:hypothetical protein
MSPRTTPPMRPLVRGQSGLAAWDCCVPGAEVEVGATGGVLQPPIVVMAATTAATMVTLINVLEIAGGGEVVMDQVALGRSCKGLRSILASNCIRSGAFAPSSSTCYGFCCHQVPLLLQRQRRKREKREVVLYSKNVDTSSSFRQERRARPCFSSSHSPWPNSFGRCCRPPGASGRGGRPWVAARHSNGRGGSALCGRVHAAPARATGARSRRTPRPGAGIGGRRAAASAPTRSPCPSTGPDR